MLNRELVRPAFPQPPPRRAAEEGVLQGWDGCQTDRSSWVNLIESAARCLTDRA